MPITPTFVFVNTAGAAQNVLDQVEDALLVAFEQWSGVLAGSMNTTMRVEILQQTSSGRAQGGPAQVLAIGAPNGGTAWEGTAAYELRHGANANGSDADLLMQLDIDYLLDELFFDATPATSNDIPNNRTDAISVFLHEIGHGLGFTGYYDEENDTFFSNANSPYDTRIGLIGGEVYFSGPNTLAEYGDAVPLTNNNYAHYGNTNAHPSGGDPLAGLMNGVVYYRGTRYAIADIELAFMADMGLGTINNDIFDQIWLDVIRGGAGDDVFVGNYSAAASGVSINGAPTIRTAPGLQLHDVERFDVTLSTHNDTFTGTENNDVVRGGDGIDVLNGAAGSDSIDGGLGADAMTGGSGDDTFFVDNAGDTVIENASEGTDTIRSGVGVSNLAVNVENLVLLGAAITGNGNALNNTITGNAQNNSINGQAGADTMIGGLGNDTYFVDDLADAVVENSGEGTDIIFSTVNVASLAANVENLTISALALTATGNFLNNTIAGNAQNNTLNGGSGEDTLIGGIGNDLYIVNSAGDVVTEGLGAGTDSILAFINIATLVANVENVTLAGTATSATGNELSNILTGNGLDNTLVGGLGADQLNGGVGADTMSGGGGDDAYLVENAGDVTIELGGEGNADIVYAFVTLASLAANIERVTITGVGNLNATGNALGNRVNGNANNNVLTGLDGADVIQGLAGTDTINGGAGLDIMTGGADADTFVFGLTTDSGVTGATRDVINDFAQGSDIISLTAIDAITGGGDNAFSFIGAGVFTNAAGQLRYDQIDNASGADYTIISMDVNGDGVADSQITLIGLVTLTVSDFGL